MKKLIALFVIAGSASLFAASGTYNDLGDYQGQDNSFWNTKAHVAPAIDAESSVAVASVATQDRVVSASETMSILDTVVFATAIKTFAVEFCSDLLGLMLFVR